jgi:hypothetical protein
MIAAPVRIYAADMPARQRSIAQYNDNHSQLKDENARPVFRSTASVAMQPLTTA